MSHSERMAQHAQPTQRRKALSIWGLAEAFCVLLLTATLAGFLARGWWVFELTTHFRPHLAVILSAGAIVWGARRRWRWAAFCAVGAVLNVAVVLPHCWPGNAVPATDGVPLKVVLLNVNTANTRSDSVLQFLREADADIVLLLEVDQRWLRELEPFMTTYPNQSVQARDDNFGIALFSRKSWKSAKILNLGEAEVPSIVADIELGETTVHLLATHPLPPGSAEYARLRDEQFKRIAEHARKQSEPVVVIGDLNATPWSPRFVDLLTESALEDASKGRSIQGSWPAWLPLGRIPIDHCLVSSGVGVVSKEIGSRVGSDHLPVIVTITLPATNVPAVAVGVK